LQVTDPPWLRRDIIDKGGLKAILKSMEAYGVDGHADGSVGVQHCAW
jgi:hypothetical protein